MKKAFLFVLAFLSFACELKAQKFYFTGLGLRGMLMSDVSTDRDKAEIIRSAATGQARNNADYISNTLTNPNNGDGTGSGFVMADIFLRPQKTNHFFRWSEWTISLGYSPTIRNIQTYSYVQHNTYPLNDTTGYYMDRIIGKTSAFALESKFIINSSPYKSRLMKYYGLGLIGCGVTEKDNRVQFTKFHADNNTRDIEIYSLSNTSNFLTGLFLTGGLKYNLSCKFSVFADINLGYSWRFYPENLHTSGDYFSCGLGVKYKMGNGPIVPDDSPPPSEEDEKTKKRNRKKMEVYW